MNIKFTLLIFLSFITPLRAQIVGNSDAEKSTLTEYQISEPSSVEKYNIIFKSVVDTIHFGTHVDKSNPAIPKVGVEMGHTKYRVDLHGLGFFIFTNDDTLLVDYADPSFELAVNKVQGCSTQLVEFDVHISKSKKQLKISHIGDHVTMLSASFTKKSSQNYLVIKEYAHNIVCVEALRLAAVTFFWRELIRDCCN